MNDVTFGIIVAGRIREEGSRVERKEFAPADLTGRSTVHSWQKTICC